MLNSENLYAELGKKELKLREKYQLNLFELPCNRLRSRSEVNTFCQTLVTTLFPKDTYTPRKVDLNSMTGKVICSFRFNDQLFQLKAKMNAGIIHSNYDTLLNQLQKVTRANYVIGTRNPEGILVSGKREDFVHAQRAGYPAHIRGESIFWFTEFDGQRMAFDQLHHPTIELSSPTLLDDLEALQHVFTQSVQYLASKSKRLAMLSKEQIAIIYNQREKQYHIFINGDMVGYQNTRLSEKSIQCGFNPAGRLFAYSILKSQSSAQLSLYPTAQNPQKAIKVMEVEKFLSNIEESI